MSEPEKNRDRRSWFEQYIGRLEENVTLPEVEGARYACPCCGYPTLSERGGWDVCPICEWEDDGQDDPRADEVWRGPNGNYSLSEARCNFEAYQTMYRPEDQDRFRRTTSPPYMRKKQKLIKELKAQR